ncbi:MAG: hypothetical protein FWG50_14405, partial [Kiritimatiellaeota bacterium]|nr:hypothetical protein [Kiritimatiellota bacterium]
MNRKPYLRPKKKKKRPLFYRLLTAFVVLSALLVALLNVYISGRLTEYESAHPKHAAARLFEAFFREPDFLDLIARSGYELGEWESVEDAVAYFDGLAAEGPFTYTQVTS